MSASALGLAMPPSCAPLYKWGTRTVSRAHLSLQDRREAVVEAGRLLDSAAQRLAVLLQTKVGVAPHLLDAACWISECLGVASVFAVIELSALNARAVLELDLGLALAVIQQLSGEAAPPGIGATELTRVERAALAYALLVALGEARSRAELERIWAPRLLAVETERQNVVALFNAEACIGVDLLMEVNEVKGRGRFLIPARALQTAISQLPRSALVPLDSVLAAQVALRRFLPKLELEGITLRSIKTGDVVMLPEVGSSCSVSDEGRTMLDTRLELRGPLFILKGRLSVHGFDLDHAAAVAPLPEEPMSLSEATIIQDTSHLPVEVEVELTRVSLPLAALGTLRPGRILPLRICAGEPVVLRIGDRAVARAELVELEGEVGARILEMVAEVP